MSRWTFLYDILNCVSFHVIGTYRRRSLWRPDWSWAPYWPGTRKCRSHVAAGSWSSASTRPCRQSAVTGTSGRSYTSGSPRSGCAGLFSWSTTPRQDKMVSSLLAVLLPRKNCLCYLEIKIKWTWINHVLIPWLLLKQNSVFTNSSYDVNFDTFDVSDMFECQICLKR